MASKKKKDEIKKDVLNEKEKIENESTENVKNEEDVSKENDNKVEKDEEKKEKVKLDKVENKSNIVAKDPAEVLAQNIKEKKNKRSYVIINIILTLIFIVLFSTIFAFINMNSSTIIKGIQIKDIDISNLTLEEARTKVSEAIELELVQEINLYYSDEYNIDFKPSQIDAMYNIEESITEAFSYGREGSLIENNYEILFAGIFGKKINVDLRYNEERLNVIVDDIASKIPGKVIEYNYSIEGEELIIVPGTKGIKVDTYKLKNDIISDVKSRNAKNIINNNEKRVINIKAESVEPESINIDKIYSEVYKIPVDAYYETNPFKLYPEVNGVDFNISIEEAKKIVSNSNEKEYKIPLKITKPAKTVNDIGTEAFPYLISEFSTRYNASDINRSQNLELSAEKINGTVLMPGEEFSYNQVVGKRTVEAGYKDAKIYANGQVVDGLGGGICQISSTLYNAVLLADLEITERRNHYFKTSYVAAGRDATVVWGSIDFKFKNSRTYPIKIEANVQNGIAEFKIHGIKEETEYEIKILPVITQNIPNGIQEIVDPTLAPGTRRITQSGASGCKVTTYIEKRLDGKVVSKEAISSDTYRPMTQIVKVSP